ncbi:transposase [Acidiphilium sp. 20-67-58]|uniref:transposase n=1 Tax=Acidiphilium sp. 20-67-58 TaxID=1970291 RepID=UPI00345859E4
MWTPTPRAQHSRTGLRYGSDVTDAEWLLLSPFLPAPSRCGRHRKWESWEMREIVNAIFYVLRGGIAWSLLPKDFPSWPTAYRRDRERAGREASPTAAVIDSQSIKTTESGGPRGYNAGKKIKKIKGRKRHAMVDTDGRALKLQAHSAAIQDRDGAVPLLRVSRASWPFVALGYADGGYAGTRVANASPIRIKVVRKADNQVGFAVIARRWVVERFFAWINRNRRLAKYFEATIESVEAFLYAASSVFLLRRLAL